MREVTVERFVPATPAAVRRALTPTAVVEYEGSFAVRETTDTDEGTLVTAGARGLELRLRFEPRENGWYYEQAGDGGPFDAMETRLSVAPRDDGSVVAARSAVSLGLPLGAVTDRIAAWKRRGELRRALDALADDLG
jgi:hypothetical protein